MAFALSMWIQLLITLFLSNLVRWCAAILAAAQQFDEQLAAEAQTHVTTESLNRFSGLFRLLMVFVWATLAEGERAQVCWKMRRWYSRVPRLVQASMLLVLLFACLLAPSSPHLEPLGDITAAFQDAGSLDGLHCSQIIHTALVAIGTALPALCYSVLIGNWANVFRTYKQRMLRMRRGVYFFDRKVYREESANQYVGYQVAGMTIASLSCESFSARLGTMALTLRRPTRLKPLPLE